MGPEVDEGQKITKGSAQQGACFIDRQPGTLLSVCRLPIGRSQTVSKSVLCFPNRLDTVTGSTTASLRTLHSNPAPLIYHGQYDGTYSIHDWRCIMMSMAIIFSIVLLHAFRAAPDVHGKSLSPRRHVTTSVSLSQVHEYY